jgi:hypothetical protein
MDQHALFALNALNTLQARRVCVSACFISAPTRRNSVACNRNLQRGLSQFTFVSIFAVQRVRYKMLM